jgi:hypothetical protein
MGGTSGRYTPRSRAGNPLSREASSVAPACNGGGRRSRERRADEAAGARPAGAPVRDPRELGHSDSGPLSVLTRKGSAAAAAGAFDAAARAAATAAAMDAAAAGSADEGRIEEHAPQLPRRSVIWDADIPVFLRNSEREYAKQLQACRRRWRAKLKAQTLSAEGDGDGVRDGDGGGTFMPTPGGLGTSP